MSLRACLKRLFRNEFFVESNNATLQHFLDLQCHAPQSYISQVLRTLKRSCSEQLFGPIKMSWFLADLLVKFIYSEKATKFCKIFSLLLTTVHTVKSKGKISQNFVAFSEYMNFMTWRTTLTKKCHLQLPKNE